jgi:hypothetical protein
MTLVEKKDCGPFDEPVRKKVSPAQEVFLLLYRMDSQILNGGVTQFVWNAPVEFDDARKAMKRLGQSELAELYKKAEDRVEEKMKDYEPLWVKGHQVGGEVGKECFFKTYALLDLKWFDKAYLAKHRTKMVKALIDLVVKKKAEFVK